MLDCRAWSQNWSHNSYPTGFVINMSLQVPFIFFSIFKGNFLFLVLCWMIYFFRVFFWIKFQLYFHFFEWLQFLSTFWVNLLFRVLFFFSWFSFFSHTFLRLLVTQNLCLRDHHTRPVGNGDSINYTISHSHHSLHLYFNNPPGLWTVPL